MIATNIKTLTLSDFASLPPAWPEQLDDGGVLIARIHPDCNRGEGDEHVLARALVFDPEALGEHSCLRRLTIRTTNLVPVVPDGMDAPQEARKPGDHAKRAGSRLHFLGSSPRHH